MARERRGVAEPEHVRTTRESYDLVAVDYERQVRDELAAIPMDRAVLALFAQLVQIAGAGTGVVADVDCGPGRITANLRSLGCDVFGVDVSPGMIAVARRSYPESRFETGSMTELDVADGSLGGLVAWYSVIHTPPDLLPTVFAEFRRVLAPGGRVVLAFGVGDERVHLEHAYGHAVSIDAYRLAPENIAQLLSDAGLLVHTRICREPIGNERSPQPYVMAARPSAP